MRCPICERAELVETVQNYRYRECGLDNVILMGITVRVCPLCDTRVPKIPRIEGLHDCIAHALVKKEERLTPAEIVFLRKALGWSGTDFARNMQCDNSQVSKWENGKVPMSKSNELLFREIIARGKKIEDYHREDAARKAADQVVSLVMRIDEVKRRWEEAELQEAA
jgi:putative zinc finger/helix-turn-helix YgiT family protein